VLGHNSRCRLKFAELALLPAAAR